MNRRLQAFALGLSVFLLGCSQGHSSQASTTTSSSLSTTTTTQSSVYEPYANTAAAVVPAGTVSEGSLRTPDGRTRTYRVYVPSTLPAGTRVPLLLAFHGGGGRGRGFEGNSGYNGLAESNGFVVAYPDGTSARGSNELQLVWNGGVCCGAAVERDVDDVEFIRLLLDELERTQPVDTGRVFASGHSNGAIFSYRLACELSDRIAAIGVQSGGIGVPCEPARPVSVFHVHGLADTNIPVDGGKGSGVSGVVFPSPRAAPLAFATFDQCGEGPTDTLDPTNSDVVARTWSACSEQRSIRFVTVKGASHAWMGHDDAAPAARSLVGIPYEGFDSSRAIWSFLAVQPPR